MSVGQPAEMARHQQLLHKYMSNILQTREGKGFQFSLVQANGWWEAMRLEIMLGYHSFNFSNRKRLETRIRMISSLGFEEFVSKMLNSGP